MNSPTNFFTKFPSLKGVSPHILYTHCYGRYALAAVNVFTMEQVLALFDAAQSSASPVIVQLTPAARNYAQAPMLMAMVKAAAQLFPETVYAIHLDHGIEDHIHLALQEGYHSVMIDASHDDFETNIARTRAIVERAHPLNIQVEAELGVLSGIEDDIDIDAHHARYTKPEQAKEFVSRTGCDSLAVAVGTSHGAYKFEGKASLKLNILRQIQQQLPGFPLVLHGSSSVPRQLVDDINRFGGHMQEHASGVSDEDLAQGIALGICKVNIATDLRLLWARVHRQFFHEQPEQFDPVIPGREYMKQYKAFMQERFEVLRSAGQSKNLKLDHA